MAGLTQAAPAGIACLTSAAPASQIRAVAANCSPSWRNYGGSRRSDWLSVVRVRACLPSRTCLACHKVTLVSPAGEHLVEVRDGEYILDAAERGFPNANFPSSCRTGGCSSCAGRLTSGQVDQSSQTFLDDNQIRLGYVLTCVAYPLSDAVIRTHQEEQLY